MSTKGSLVDFILPNSFHEKTAHFCKILLSYNKIHNVSGVRTKKDIMENIIDSIYPIKYLDKSYKKAIDIGSGAGFPGLFLAMVLEDCKFTLFEPIAKKSSFLYFAKIELDIANIKIQSEKIENSPKEVVDLIVSRAVGDVKLLMNLSSGFYNEETTFLFYKGERAKEEIKDIKNVKIHIRDKRQYVLMKGEKC